MELPAESQSRPRFITGLGWTFLILACWNTLVTAPVLAGFLLVGLGAGLEVAAREMESRGAPQAISFLIRFGYLQMALMIPAGLFTALAAFRLLQLREWARRAFLGILLVLSIVILISLGLSLSMQSFAQKQLAADSSDWASMWARFGWVAFGLAVLRSLGMVALFGWCMSKLQRPEIRRAFRPGL